MNLVLRRFKSLVCRHEDVLIWCKECQLFKPVPSRLDKKTAFALFLDGSKPSMNPDLAKARQRYLELQRDLHPDRQSESSNWSAWLNSAYDALRDPMKRAEILFGIGEEELDKVQMDSGTLMKVMDLRERIEETERAEELLELEIENEARIKEILSLVEGQEEGACLIGLLAKLRYWIGVRKAINERKQF